MSLSPQSWATPTRLFLRADGVGGGGPGTSSDSAERDKDLDLIEGLGDKGKAAIKAERDARAEAERKLNDLSATVTDLQKEKQKREADEAKAREQQIKDAGQYQELAETLEKKLADATTELETLRTENTRFKEVMSETLKEQWGTLPDPIQRLWKGDEEDILGKYDYLNDKDVREAASKMTERPRPPGGSAPNPPAGSDVEKSVAQERDALVNTGAYGM